MLTDGWWMPDPNGPLASTLRRAGNSLGFKVSRVSPGSVGVDAFRDMRHLAADRLTPVVIDAGANVGQSVRRFKEVFPGSRIHSFEPSPSAFVQLRQAVTRYPGVSISNCGLGAQEGEAKLFENTFPDMTSFLRPGPSAWGTVARETTVAVATVDRYSEQNGISAVEVLKTDTQGFDLEVLKGCSRLMASRRIHMVYVEIIFSPMYEGMPPWDEILTYLRQSGFKLVSFYGFHFQDDLASWSDALFVDPSFTAG